MAELMKLLDTNGAFKSDLMQTYLCKNKGDTSLSGLSYPMTGASVQSSMFMQTDVNFNPSPPSPSEYESSPSITLSSPPFPSHLESTIGTNLNDNKTFTHTGGNLNGNTAFVSNPVNANSPCPRIVSYANKNTSSLTNLNQLNKTNVTSGSDNNNGVANINIEAVSDQLENLNINANLGSLKQGKKLDANGARPAVPDTNANNAIDVAQILSEVSERLTGSKQLLVEQVINATVDAHMNTTINTHANVAAANERIQREMNEMPEMSLVNGSNLWQHFMAAMVPEITKVIQFSTKLPGFPEIEQEDKIRLIKQGCFEVMVARFCILVDHVKEEMLDPTLKVKAPRNVVKTMPMGPFLDQFFDVAGQFNPLGLTDQEIGLFTAVLMICPEREGLTSQETVKVLQRLFIQALYQLLKQSHTDAEQTLSSLLNMVPVFHKINADHLKFLRMIKMKSPAEFEKKFPPLHKELFDTC